MSIATPPGSSTRLVTQNLLVSAAAAAEPGRYVEEENVSDLATIITLCCLYDRLVLVGPAHLLEFDSPLLNYLRREVVETREIDGSDWQRAVSRAERYAGEFLGLGGLRGADAIFDEIYNMSRRYGVDIEPDGPSDVYTGKRLLEGVADVEQLRDRLRRQNDDKIVIAYVLRTFLYVGLSDQLRTPIAIDAARHNFVSEVADDSYRRLRDEVMKQIGDTIRANSLLPRQVKKVASPFAAIVFHETNDRAEFVPRIKQLRDHHLALRLRLRPLEEALLTGVGAELEQAEARMAAAIDALNDTHSRKAAADLSIRRIMAWAKPLADLLLVRPGKALEAAGERMLALDAQTTLAELHQLHRKQPSTAEQDHDIHRHFGL